MNTNAKQSEAPATFETVLREELEQMDNRRQRLDLGAPPSPEDASPLDQARKRRLVGLCFSGGGIRRATFNLGVLQGLAGLGLLSFIDYLSTVSGGGDIGGRLAALIRRRGSLKTVEREVTGNNQYANHSIALREAG